MNNSLLKQILREYEEKRKKAIEEAEVRKKELLKINPRLAEIEKELAYISIQTAKSILLSNSNDKTDGLKPLFNKSIIS